MRLSARGFTGLRKIDTRPYKARSRGKVKRSPGIPSRSSAAPNPAQVMARMATRRRVRSARREMSGLMTMVQKGSTAAIQPIWALFNPFVR